MSLCALVMGIAWIKQSQETYFWGRSEESYSGNGTFMITSGAYASYQKDFGCLTGTIKTGWIMGNLRFILKSIFKKSPRSAISRIQFMGV